MNRKILVVDDSAVVLETLADVLGESYVVHTATTAEAALRACGEIGPFAVVVTDYEMPEMNGIELLAVLEKHWPDTTRMMLAEDANLDLAVQALRSGSIFRFLSKLADNEELYQDVRAGVEKYQRLEEERLLTEQLQFSRESLLTLTESLEHRLAAQIGRLRGMHGFAAELNECRAMHEVAELTARTVSRLLEDRPVEVVLEGIEEADVRAVEGGPMPEDTVTQSVATRDGSVGRIRIAVGPPTARRMTRADLDFLSSIAASTAVAAHNQINRYERDNAQHATIFALAQLAEYRDDETGKHLERVTQYCQLIAEALREERKHLAILTDSFVHDLGLAAPLHDIGKVGVPDAILLKPGKLTEEEWVTMRMHATIGAETLKSVLENSGEQSFLRMGHEIAWCHHERWDGKGYPRGLRGEEIPLAARIMALADCYDALTTRRPYKEPWSHRETLNYVIEQRGIHFDPDIVDSFERHEHRFDEIRQRMADESGQELPDSLGDVA